MTDEDLDRHIRAIRAREKGWSDDLDDSGGPTHDGITLEIWLKFHGAIKPANVSRFDFRSVWAKSLHDASDGDLMECYRWYFRTQGLDELIEEFGVPDELVPLVMDMRTLHSVEGCREILRNAISRIDPADDLFGGAIAEPAAADIITLARMRYMLEVAERRPKDRKFVRGWMHRALKAIGWWPPKPETREV